MNFGTEYPTCFVRPWKINPVSGLPFFSLCAARQVWRGCCRCASNSHRSIFLVPNHPFFRGQTCWSSGGDTGRSQWAQESLGWNQGKIGGVTMLLGHPRYFSWGYVKMMGIFSCRRCNDHCTNFGGHGSRHFFMSFPLLGLISDVSLSLQPSLRWSIRSWCILTCARACQTNLGWFIDDFLGPTLLSQFLWSGPLRLGVGHLQRIRSPFDQDRRGLGINILL